MENHNIQESQNADRPPIRVVNGEAKKSSGKKRKILLSFAGIALLAGLGTTGYLYSEEKTASQELNNQVSELNNEIEAIRQKPQDVIVPVEPKEDKSTAPEGWSEHNSEEGKYNFFHPDDWKVTESKASGFGEHKPDLSIDVSEKTSNPQSRAQITIQRYASASKDDLYKVLKSKQYWDGECEEHTSVIADTLVYGLSCGPELVNGQALTNYYAFEKEDKTFVIYHDQQAGLAGPQQRSLVYQGVLSSLSFQ